MRLVFLVDILNDGERIYRMSKITVLGGAGFVGTNLCRYLSEKQKNFEIIDLKVSRQFPEKSKIGDVRKIDDLEQTITGDIIVNLAAVHRDDVRDRTEYYRTNVDGARNLTQVCENKGIKKIVFTSSVAVYGFAKPGTGECGDINPYNDYGHSKSQAEDVLAQWAQHEGNSLIVVRPTVIFGAGNRGNVYNLFRQIKFGKFLMIGSGKNKKSMAYIGNVVSFLDACIQSKQKTGVYNYVDTPDLTMNELVGLVRKKLLDRSGVGVRLPYWLGMGLGFVADFVSRISGKKFPVSAIRVRKFTSDSAFSSDKMSMQSFSPPFDLIDGIERTLDREFVNVDPDQEVFFTE